MNKKIIIPILLAILLVGNVLALTITSVSTNPNQVGPGEQVSLSLTIKNNDQDYDAENVKISLMLNGIYSQTGILLNPAVPFSPYQSSSQFSFDTLESDDSKTVDFNLIANADADSGSYNIPVQIDYTLNNIAKTDTGVISVIINALPEITINTDSTGLIKGQSNDLTIKIVNSGLGDAKFSNLKIGSVLNAKILSGQETYIGDINKDDFDSVKISLQVNANAPGIITIPVNLTYKDSRNKQYAETENIKINAYTLKQAQQIGLVKKSNIGLYITLVVIVIIIYLFYRWIRKRRKNKLANGGVK